MAKNKQQKQKERERRVAKEKLAAAEHRRTLEKSDKDTHKPASAMAKIMSGPVAPKTGYVANNAAAKSNFSHRRTGA